MQLIIDTYGARVSCHNQMFRISGKGLETAEFPVREVTALQIGKGVHITSDAIFLAIAKDIPMVFAKGSGRPAGSVWHGHFGSIATIRKAQLRFAESPDGLEWIKGIINRKMQYQQAFMYRLAYSFPDKQSAVLGHIRHFELVKQRMSDYRISKGIFEPDRIKATFRGWEGTCSRHYFQSLSGCLPQGYQFQRREGRPAKDRFNCALNYAYGILYGNIEASLIKAGIDPQIGIFHADQYANPVMVFDVIEPYRVWADETVFQLCHAYLLGHDCFEPKDKGMWLSSKGKKILIEAFSQHLASAPPTAGIKHSRQSIVNIEAKALAQLFLKW